MPVFLILLYFLLGFLALFLIWQNKSCSQRDFFGNLIKSLGAYPVNREGFDRKAIRQAVSLLEEGWATGIFIEGTRTPDGRIHNPKLGAALIAAKAQAPLLPVALCGTEKIVVKGQKLPKSVKVHLKIGDIIPPPTSGKKKKIWRLLQLNVPRQLIS